MKKIPLSLIAMLFIQLALAQVDTFTNPVTKDSVISTAFDTLRSSPDKKGKIVVQDKVVGIRNVHKKQSEYWLFFYFTPTDLKADQTITIGKNKYAYLVNDAGTYLRIPYDGKTFTYNSNQMAGFFINITKHLEQLKNSSFTFIRLETSDFYHEIALEIPDQTIISDIIAKLTNAKVAP